MKLYIMMRYGFYVLCKTLAHNKLFYIRIVTSDNTIQPLIFRCMCADPWPGCAP